MTLRKGTIQTAHQGAIDIYYLKKRDECDPGLGDPECAGIAAGVERYWMDFEQQLRSSSKHQDVEFAARQVERWSTFADACWQTACDALARGLPAIDAFMVVPSRRSDRREPLVSAIRSMQSAAIELLYEKGGEIDFGRSDHHQIKAALRRVDQHVLAGPKRIAVVDDWMGGGNTFLAVAERLRTDHPAADLTVLGAFPGISKKAAAMFIP